MNEFEAIYKSQLEMVSVRRVKEAPIMSEKKINSPEDAVKLLGQYLCELDREVLCVINIKANGVPVNCSICSMGSVNITIAHPRELLKTAILSNAAAIIIVHNHPSGDLKPSQEDVQVTDQMMQVCRLIDIPLLDHIIVGGDNRDYFSFKEKKLLPDKNLSFKTDIQELNLKDSAIAEDKDMQVLVRPRHRR